MSRTKPLRRKTALGRGRKLAPVNRKRKAASDARNFGDEAERVRSMPCLCGHVPVLDGDPHGRPTWCRGTVQAAHLVPLCDAHHREAGEAGTSQRAAFEQRYGLDLRAEADRIALEHPRPLGIRGLVDRWLIASTHDGRGILDPYEIDALLGWVHREMAREVEQRKYESRAWAEAMRLTVEAGEPWVLGEHLGLHDRDALAHHIALVLGDPFNEDSQAVHVRTLSGRTKGEHSLAWTLCEAAANRFGGWPS